MVNTNKALLHTAVYDGKVHITSVIDNLLKGASGQAVQNMNLMFGLDEKEGLRLNPDHSAYRLSNKQLKDATRRRWLRATIRGFASKPSPPLALLVRIFLDAFFAGPDY